ncbi:Ig-like domain repeat protein [Edwardsiella hoshinae]|uniref:Carbohydrate-binding module 48 (Isoamylase N-terminal domain) n=1 Tax=Edwardsiella hoshinae TaxID=93378 RepID=A0A376DBV4_9GAMM|nr:Ig-like domain-containing protein [Edwardsiella hoshinae]QPR27648.1 Ig-like domain repeat protein [Edwardsiella hoshinae]STC86562.1 Carbohydrate-binding module 48 (Isoamylase N-terminal domain) [Edwardsiella hoshinae]
MKSINVNNFDSENIRVEKLKVSGFDVIVTDTQGERIRIVDGLPDILTGTLKLLNSDGQGIETTAIVNSIDASKLGLDVAVLGSLLDGNDVESAVDAAAGTSADPTTSDNAQERAQAEKLAALLAENKQLREQLSESEKQAAHEEKVQLQVEKSTLCANETLVEPQTPEPAPPPGTAPAKKKKPLDDGGGGSSSPANEPPSPTGNGQHEVTLGQHVPLTAALSANSDTGIVGDNITRVTSPLFSGTTAPFAQLTLTIGSATYSTTADAQGNWSIAVTHDLAEGGNSYTVSAADSAGNSTTINGVVVIDTVAQTITATLDGQSDSGVQGDFITHDTTPTLTGTAEAGAAMTLVINGTTYTFNADASGNWHFTLPSALAEGKYDYTVNASDVAGNHTSYSGALTIDTSAPALTSKLDLSNTLYGDNVIGNSQPIFSGTAEAGSTITLSIADATYTLIVNPDGQWSFSVPVALANKEWPYTISATDSAGNQTVIHDQVIIQNKDAVAQIGVTAGLDTSTDSGTLGDNITSNPRPILTGTSVANAVILLTLAGVTYTTTTDSHGNWSIDFANDFVDGVHDYSVTATAPDGTMGLYSGSFTIDTIAPSIAVNLEAQSDSGIVGDEITNVKQPVLTGLTEPYATVVITIDGSAYQTTANSAGEWSIAITHALSEGQNDYTVTITDVAGNNASATGSITLDTEVAPLTGIKFSDGYGGRYSSTYTPTIEGWGEAGATLNIAIGSRSYTITIPESRKWFFYVPAGFIQAGNTTQYITFKETDAAGNTTSTTIKFHFITDKPDISADIAAGSDTGIIGDKTTSDTSPMLSGRVTSPALTPSQLAQSKVALTIDGITYSGIAVNSNGSWSFTLPVTLSPGYSYNYTVSVTDFVGNTNSYTSYVTINTLSGKLDAVSITGENSMTETADASPTLSGSATAGSTLTLYINNHSYHVPVTALGTWTFKVPDALGNGKYTFTLVEKTAAGVTNTFNGHFIVDSKTPDVLTAEVLAPASGSNNVVNHPDVTLQGKTEALALVTILIGGITYQTSADANGNWSYTFDNGAFAINSTINYQVTASDAAGNKTTINGSFMIDTIDVSADLAINSNSGNPHDNITNVSLPTFAGNTAANAEISLVINGEKYTTTADSNGKWSITLDSTLPDNTYHYAVSATLGDKVNYAAGEVVIDTSALPPTLNLATDSDSGVIGDYITNVTTPTLTGISEPNAKVMLTLNGITHTITAGNDGSWSFVVPTPLTEGDNAYSIGIIDSAGNTSSAVTGHITLDTLPPNASATLRPADDSGNVGDDITNVATPTLTGSTEPGATVTLVINNYTYATRADEHGTWSLTISDALPNGNNTYTITVSDIAGNQATTSGHLVIDTIAPEVEDITVANADHSDITDTSIPIFSGTASETEVKITISFAGDEQKYDVTLNPDGSWHYQHNTPFPLGSHEYTLEISDIAGNSSTTSGTFEVVSNISTPSQPEESTSPVELAGVAEAHAQIEITLDEAIYRTQADQNGNWSLLTAPYPAGDYEYCLKMTNAAGEISEETNAIKLVPDDSAPLVSVSNSAPAVSTDHGEAAVLSLLASETAFEVSSHDEPM